MTSSFPQGVNAYYIPYLNTFVAPSVLFGFPMYDETSHMAHAIASLGYTLAHEMAHGFDNKRAKYGHDGRVSRKGLWMPPSNKKIRVSYDM